MNNLRKQADDHRNSGRVTEAVRLYEQIYATEDSASNWQSAGEALQMIGVSYKINNDTKNALKYLKRAVDYYKRHDIEVGIANALRDIGITYEYINRLTLAEENLRKSLLISKRISDDESWGITLAKIGFVETRQKKYRQAEKNLSEAVIILKGSGRNWFYTATALGHLANLYIEIKHFDRAIEILNESLKMFDDHGNEAQTRRYAQGWGLLAFAYANLGQIDKAKDFLHKSLHIVLSSDFSQSAAAVVLRDIRADKTITKLMK
ncbi:MAG: tetratricopeptide repeat protein [Patescibacteria group bacterium]|jgi:tetratricopeptide (TPR) repeat protein